MGFHEKSTIASICSFSLLIITLCCLLTPISALKRFGEPCTMGMECESRRCSTAKKTCACAEVKSLGSKTKVEQIFDKDLGMCLSRVGQICTLDNADKDLVQLLCIPDATCDPNFRINMELSYCACKRGYEQHKNRCISQVELRALNVKAPLSMDQTMDGWTSSGSSSSKFGNSNMISCISVFFLTALCSLFPFR